MSDISIIITSELDTPSIHYSLRNIQKCIENIEQDVEVIVVFSHKNNKVRDTLKNNNFNNFLIVETQNTKLIDLLNDGIEKSSGDIIVFSESGNLISQNFISKGIKRINSEVHTIFHPEYVVDFNDNKTVHRQISSNSKEFNKVGLLIHNYWERAFITTKEIINEVKPSISIWNWYLEILENNINHALIPNTLYFIRGIKGNEELAPIISINNNEPLSISNLKSEKVKFSFKNPFNHITYTFLHLIKTSIRSFFYTNPKIYLKLREFGFQYPKLYTSFIRLIVKLKINNLPLTNELDEEWKKIHLIEPNIFPDENYKVKNNHSDKNLALFRKLYFIIPNNSSYIFLVPWLKTGGAEKVTLNYINALLEIHPLAKISVIATMNTDSPWRSKLDNRVNFVDFGNICSKISKKEQEQLLGKLLIQKKPKAIHNILSDLGHKVFQTYGKSLKENSKLYASFFNSNPNSEGKEFDYSHKYLPETIDHLSGISSDNKYYLEKLQDMHGFNKEKFHVHYQPTKISQLPIPKRKRTSNTLNILWASRLNEQKRPDMLAKIIEKTSKKPVHFHVFGTSLFGIDEKLFRTIKNSPNSTYHGGFDEFESLPLDDKDLFLYTSQRDGLPNVLLEAINAEIPVIAPKIGGIPEIIKHNSTGILVDDHEDVDQYVAEIDNFVNNKYESEEISKKAKEELLLKHAWEQFTEGIKSFPGYVD